MSDEQRRNLAAKAILDLMKATGCDEDADEFLEDIKE